MRITTRARLALISLASLLAWTAAAVEPPDWNSVADVDTVSVVTANSGGTLRYTTVWLVVVGGRGYLRTGDTTWGGSVARNPDIKLVIGDQEYPLRVEFVEVEDERVLVEKAFNEKYGWSDTLIGWFRGDRPKIMRLTAR
jgi:hypothetical protein